MSGVLAGKAGAVTEPHLLFRLLDLLLANLLTDGCFLHTKDVRTPLGQLLQAALDIQTWIESGNREETRPGACPTRWQLNHCRWRLLLWDTAVCGCQGLAPAL